MSRLSFASVLLSRVPPWLRRMFGGPLLRGLADPLDSLADKTRESVRARFPDAARADALAAIGTERRIRRGPSEEATVYASRLISWWDDHRGRGGPYALANQLYLFWKSALGVDFEIVGVNGVRHSVNGQTGSVSRDTINWTGGGDPAQWAQLWIFFHNAGTMSAAWDSGDGDTICDENGEEIVFDVPLYSISDEDAELFRVVPREWSAAHIKKITVVLLYGNGWVLGYPTGIVLGDGHVLGEDAPTIVTVED